MLLAILTITAYLPAVRGGFIWDDEAYVTNNVNIRSPDGLRKIWLNIESSPQYYPLVFTSFRMEYRLWKLWAPGYHLTNVLLHLLNALLLWVILRRLSVAGAFLAAAIFAVHPVNVESVAWITERKNTLSGFFYLCSILAYLRFAGIGPDRRFLKGEGAAGRSAGWWFYAAALTFFMAALLSKTVTATMPAALLVVVWWKDGRLNLRRTVPLLPFFLVGAIMGSLTGWLEKYHVGAAGADWALSFPERILVAGRAVLFYAGKLLWPAELCFNYRRWQLDATNPWQYLFPLAVALALAILWLQRRKIGTGPLAASLFFCLTLAPALGFFDFYPMRFSFVADHFQYLAAIGLIVLLSACLQPAVSSDRQGMAAATPPGSARFRLSAASRAWPFLILIPLWLLTWRQGFIYRDMETLWRDTLHKNSASWLANSFLGLMLLEHGKTDEGLVLTGRAAVIKPDDPKVRLNYGLALHKKGRLAEAMIQYREALRLQPDLQQARINLAIARTGEVAR